MRDGEHPTTNGRGITTTVGKPANDRNEHVAEKVFRFGRTGTAQVTQHRGRELAVEVFQGIGCPPRLRGGRPAHTPPSYDLSPCVQRARSGYFDIAHPAPDGRCGGISRSRVSFSPPERLHRVREGW